MEFYNGVVVVIHSENNDKLLNVQIVRLIINGERKLRLCIASGRGNATNCLSICTGVRMWNCVPQTAKEHLNIFTLWVTQRNFTDQLQLHPTGISPTNCLLYE